MGQSVKCLLIETIRGGADFGRQIVARAIEARRRIPLERLIYALGIRRIGEANARLLARHYGGSVRASLLVHVVNNSTAVAIQIAMRLLAPQ